MKWSVMMLVLAACGSDKPTMMMPDAGPTAMAACGDSNFALVALTDYMTPGHAAKIGLVPPFALAQDDALALGEDSALKRIGGELFVINEYGATDADNVQAYDARDLSKPTLSEVSIGHGTDPSDLVVGADGRVYVCELEGAGIAVIERAGDAGHKTHDIALSTLDPDGTPNCVALYQKGNLLFAFLALWDDTQTYKPPRGPGKVAIVDISNQPGTLVGSFDLMNQNPSGWVHEEPGTPNVLLATTGDYSGTTGGIERVDLDARTSRGLVLTAAALGNRYVSDFVVLPSGDAFVSAVDPASTDGQSNLYPFSMSGQVGPPMVMGHAAGMAIDGCSHLWLIDRGYGMGAANSIRVLDAQTKTQIGQVQTTVPPRFWGGIVFVP